MNQNLQRFQMLLRTAYRCSCGDQSGQPKTISRVLGHLLNSLV